jgi:hypothetical protein
MGSVHLPNSQESTSATHTIQKESKTAYIVAHVLIVAIALGCKLSTGCHLAGLPSRATQSVQGLFLEGRKPY